MTNEEIAQLYEWSCSDDDGDELLEKNRSLTTFYNSIKFEFSKQVKRSERVSRGSGGLYVSSERIHWSAVLYTRIHVISKSILKLLPSTGPGEHWDFSSIASLARNLCEAYFMYFWLCEDDVLDDVRDGRFILLRLHDHGSRKRLFSEPEIAEDIALDDLISKFDANVYLRSFDQKKRNKFIQGKDTPFIQDDILERIGKDKASFRTLYRFLSEHTHTGPVSFYRMVDDDGGTGVETRREKIYMIKAISFAHEMLTRATDGHLRLFPDAEERRPHLTRRAIMRNVERAQGRAR